MWLLLPSTLVRSMSKAFADLVRSPILKKKKKELCDNNQLHSAKEETQVGGKGHVFLVNLTFCCDDKKKKAFKNTL